MDELEKLKFDNVSLFQEIQVKILSEILTLPKDLQPLAITYETQRMNEIEWMKWKEEIERKKERN